MKDSLGSCAARKDTKITFDIDSTTFDVEKMSQEFEEPLFKSFFHLDFFGYVDDGLELFGVDTDYRFVFEGIQCFVHV